MRRSTTLTLSASLVLAALAGSAAAAEVDLSGLVNANLNTYFDGAVYPPNGGPITIGGVGFNLDALPGAGTGVVQLGNTTSVDITVGEANVTTVYSIVNSAFGAFGATIGSLTFNGSGGATFVYDFTEGVNVRDHATTSFNDIATGLFASHDFGGGDHLDVQQIVLPTAFATQTLTDVVFTYDVQAPGAGQPFLAALTTTEGGVPEPATWALMLAGFGGIGGLLRRRRAGLRFA